MFDRNRFIAVEGDLLYYNLNQNPSKVIVPHTFKTSSHRVFPIAILAQLLPKFLITKGLQQIDFNSLSQNRLPYTCPDSEFLYAQCGHVVTGDISIVQNEKLRNLLRKGLKFREPVSFHGIRTFILPNLTFYLIMRGFHRTLHRERHANRGRLPLRTPGPVPLWDLHEF